MGKLNDKPAIGFVGCGNMAKAFIGGLLNSGYPTDKICLTDYFGEQASAYAASLNVQFYEKNSEVVNASDVIVFAVKPDMYAAVLGEVKSSLKPEQIIVSIAPGVSVEALMQMSGNQCRVIRTMPNTPVMVSQGCIAVVPGPNLEKYEIEIVCNILSSVGHVEVIKESLMDTFTAASGSSPAYTFVYIEAMADAAVLGGMPRDMAYRVCSQAVLGAAMMVKETKQHPAVLKDMVCSPGGTTIEAVRQLEDSGFRKSVWDAVDACRIKASKMAE